MSSSQNATKPLLFGLFAIVLVIVIMLWQKQSADKAKESAPTETFVYIQTTELDTLLNNQKPPIVIDMRGSNAFAAKHIKGSVNIAPENIESTLAQVDKTTKIVLVGSRADADNLFLVAKRLKEKNITFSILSGGFEAWDEQALSSYSAGDPNSLLDRSKVYFVSPEKARGFILGPRPPYLIDVRSKEEWETSHTENSVNIPLDELVNRKKDIPIEKEILVYGNSELQSFQAGVRLYDMNIITAKTLSGSYNDLVNKTQEPPTSN